MDLTLCTKNKFYLYQLKTSFFIAFKCQKSTNAKIFFYDIFLKLVLVLLHKIPVEQRDSPCGLPITLLAKHNLN